MTSSEASTPEANTPTASKERVPNYGRRIFWLGVFVVLLCVGYTAAWFYLGHKLETQTTAAIAELNREGVTAECTNPEARGYPFRIGLFCDHVAFADASEGIGLSAGGFRSAGQIYDWRRFVAELDGPADIDMPQGSSLKVDWQGLRASIRLASPLPERVSLEGKALTVNLASGEPLASVGDFQAHMRPNGPDVDLATSFEGLSLDKSIVDGRTLPAFSNQTDLSITNGVAFVGSGSENLRGQSGTIRTLALSTGPDTGVTLSGPFSIDTDGLLDAELKVTIRDPKGLSDILGNAFPENRDQIANGFSGLAFMGSAPTLPLKIVKGKASLGFIPLGNVPRL